MISDIDSSADTAESENQPEPSLWAAFVRSDSREDYFSGWLSILADSIPGIIQGLIFVKKDAKDNAYLPVALWPAEGKTPERIVEVTEKSLSEGCGMVVPLDPRKGVRNACYAVSYPVTVDQKCVCAVALEVTVEREADLKPVMEQVQWGTAWLEVYFRRTRMGDDEKRIFRMEAALDLLAGVQSKGKWEEAAIGFVTELSGVLKCDRVSIGFVKGRRIKLTAVSNSANFGKKMNLVTAIEDAMDEAVMMKRTVVYPVPEDEKTPPVTRKHAMLAKRFGNGSILSLPFFVENRYAGVLLLERPDDITFENADIEFCKGVSALVFPALLEKKRNERHIAAKLGESFFNLAGKFVGAGYPGRKLLVLLAAGLAVFFYVAEGSYRISADSVIEGEVKRIAAAPFDGYIDRSDIRPGDRVKRGDLLCSLDARDLTLEKLKWLSQKAQLKRQRQEAEAKHNRSETKIIRAKIEQAEAQLELVESRLERTRIVSSFEGLVVRGDLSRRLGGFVEQGEALFEITPLDQYRIILKVDEKRIADVGVGQAGYVILSAMPKEKFAFRVTRITPVSQSEEGINYFKVEARLETLSDNLRPGMEGVGKITVRQEKLIRVWTRSFVEWFHLFAWKWFY